MGKNHHMSPGLFLLWLNQENGTYNQVDHFQRKHAANIVDDLVGKAKTDADNDVEAEKTDSQLTPRDKNADFS